MPTAPQAPQNQGRLNPLPGRQLSIQAPVEAFGGGAATLPALEQVQGLADQEARREIELRERYDSQAFQGADTALSVRQTAILFDPEKGALNRKTKDRKEALEMIEQVKKDFDAAAAEAEKGLSNDLQKDAFRIRTAKRRAEVELAAKRYADGEIDRHDVDAVKLGIEESRTQAVQSAADAYLVQSAIERQIGAIYDFGRRKNMSDKLIDAEVKREVSRTHRDVIKQLADAGAAEEARKRFEFYKPELTSGDLADATNIVGESTSRQEALGITNEIMGQGLTLGEALKAAKERAGDNDNLRRILVANVKAEFEDERIARQADQHSLYEKNARLVDARPNAPARSTIAAGDWARMDAEYRDALERRAATPDNDDQAWLDFFDLATRFPDRIANMPRAEFEARYWSRFSKSNRGRAETIWKDAREAQRDPAKSAAYKSNIDWIKRVRTAFSATGIEGVAVGATMEDINKSDAQRAAFTRFEAEADDALAALFAQTGKQPTDEDRRRKIAETAYNWVKEVTIKRYRLGFDGAAADEVRKMGSLTEKEMDEEEFGIPADTKKQLYQMALSSKMIPQLMDQAQFETVHRAQMNRAYFAGLRRESDQRIKQILEGK